MTLEQNIEGPRGIKIRDTNKRYLLVNYRIRYEELDIQNCTEKGIIFAFFKI